MQYIYIYICKICKSSFETILSSLTNNYTVKINLKYGTLLENPKLIYYCIFFLLDKPILCKSTTSLMIFLYKFMRLYCFKCQGSFLAFMSCNLNSTAKNRRKRVYKVILTCKQYLVQFNSKKFVY